MSASLGNAVGAAGGIGKYFEGRKMQKKAQSYIDSFEWKELKNAYENQQVSTLGADYQREELARMSGTSVDALRQSGTRGIVGGLGRVEQQNRDLNRQIATDLDQQQQQINWAISQDNTQLRTMNEKRQTDELQGYGQMLNTGMNMKYGGIADMMNAGQAQEQTNMAIMDRIMGGMTGMGGGGGSQSPITAQYGGGLNTQGFGGGAMGGGMSGFLQGFRM